MADFFGSSLVTELSGIICHIHLINLSVFIYAGAKTHSCKHRVICIFSFFFNIAYIWKYDRPRQHIKRRDITLLTKVPVVKAVVLPVVTCRHKSWTIKKNECGRIDAFKLWCWRRLLRVPWTARRSNQSTLKEISPE